MYANSQANDKYNTLKSFGARNPKRRERKRRAKIKFARGRRTLVLIIITLFRNCRFSAFMYLINHVIAELLITG
jgi:hypothetical protein